MDVTNLVGEKTQVRTERKARSRDKAMLCCSVMLCSAEQQSITEQGRSAGLYSHCLYITLLVVNFVHYPTRTF